jgi:hypothetical protein
MLAAPEFIVAERIELLDQIEVATELEGRMLTDRVMRGQESSEFQARHAMFPRLLLLFCDLIAAALVGHQHRGFNAPSRRRSRQLCRMPLYIRRNAATRCRIGLSCAGAACIPIFPAGRAPLRGRWRRP